MYIQLFKSVEQMGVAILKKMQVISHHFENAQKTLYHITSRESNISLRSGNKHIS